MKIILIITIFFSSFNLWGQNDSDSTIIIYPQWQLNDVKNVKCIYNVTNFSEYSGDTLKFNLETESEIKVKKVLDDGYIILWKILDCNIDSISTTQFDQIIQETITQIIGLTYELKYSKNGEYLDFLNWTDIRDYYYALTDTLINKYKSGEIISYSNNYDEARESMRRRYSEKENIIKESLKIVSPFFDIYNVEFNISGNQKEYLTIKNMTDSIYFNNQTKIIEETANKLHLVNYVFMDDSQKVKLSSTIQKSDYDYELNRYLEILMNMYAEKEFTVEKEGNWIVNKRSIVSTKDYKIVIEYYIK